jgi:predicted RNase H-like HicB family nuclease
MKAIVFPAYFRRLPSGGYSIDFPDLSGCVSAGDTLEDSYEMARNALSLHLYGMSEDGDEIPQASSPETIPAETDAFIALVEGRPDMVRDEIRNRSVKKTLTIPYWMNEEAERRRLNFSQLLQEAIRERLGV